MAGETKPRNGGASPTLRNGAKSPGAFSSGSKNSSLGEEDGDTRRWCGCLREGFRTVKDLFRELREKKKEDKLNGGGDREDESQDEDIQDKSEKLFEVQFSPEIIQKMEDERRQEKETSGWARFDLFFGSFVVMNGLMIGAQTDFPQLLEKHEWQRLESFFIVVFLVELFWRAFLRGVLKTLGDPWNYFDGIIIGVSIVDIYLATSGSGESPLPGQASVLRILRLARLARLIRLFRLLKELWLLVMGIYSSFKTLLWTVGLMLVVIYVEAILMRELYAKAYPDEYNNTFWKTVWDSMLTFAQMATLDSWHDHVIQVQDRYAPILVLIYIHLIFCGLGIMNVVVGIMVHSAMEVTKDDRQIGLCTTASQQQAAVIAMRRELLSQQPMLLGYRTMWHRSECLDAVNTLLPHMASAGIGKDDYLKLLMLAEDKYENMVDIDKLMRVALSLTGSISERTMDLWIVLSEHRISSERMQALNIGLMDALTHHRFFIREHRFEEAQAAPGTERLFTGVRKQKEISRPHVSKSKGMCELLDAVEDPVLATLEGAQQRLDIIFGAIVVLNGLLIGVRTDRNPPEGSEEDLFWKRLDVYFTVAYSFEWMWRWLLVSQEYERDSQLMFTMFPRRWLESSKISTLKSLTKSFPVYMNDRFVLFDTSILLFTIIDFIGDRFFKARMGAASVRLVRIGRLLRLTRVLRAFRMLKELWVLCTSISASSRTLTWTVLLLSVVLYGAGVLLAELVGQHNHPAAARFSGVIVSMFTLLRMSTFDGWADDIRDLLKSDIPGLAGLLLLIFFILILCGMGIMNLVIGIMCEAAFAILKETEEKDMNMFMIRQAEALDYIGLWFEDHGEKDMITRNLLRTALVDKKMKAQFLRARLTDSDVIAIFDRVAERDEVPLHTFLQACASRSAPLSHVDIVTLRLKAEQLGLCTKNTLQGLTFLFDELRHSVPLTWQKGDEKVASDGRATNGIGVDVTENPSLDTSAELKALREKNLELRELLGLRPDEPFVA